MPQTRKLGFTETYAKFCHDHANGSTILVGMVQITGPVTAEIIRQGFELLRRRQALLRAHFVESRKEDFFKVDDASGPLPFNVIQRTDPDQWIRVVEQNTYKLFSQDRQYLWRATLLLGDNGPSSVHELILALHHAIVDGISVSYLFRDLLKYCQYIAQGTPPDIETFPLLPPVEEMLSTSRSWTGFILKMLLLTFRYIRLKKNIFHYENPVPIELRRHKNIYHEIHEKQLDELIDLCRQQNTTLTGLLTAALMRAVHQVEINQKGNRRSVQLAVTPVNIRNQCSPPVERDYLGCFVDFIPTKHLFHPDTSIWEIARSYTKELNKKMRKPGHSPRKFHKATAIKMFASFEKGFLRPIFHYGIGVTNVGRLDFPSHFGPFHLNKFHFCTARQWGDWLMLLHTATIENRLYLCFSYSDPLLKENSAKAIVQKFISILESVAE